MGLRFLDLFSGIGGFHMGMTEAGHQCVGWIEIDKFARRSYEAIYATTNLYTAQDITKVQANELPIADVWCFGFPCQDISVAGKQKGITNGNRSSLFFATTELIRQLEDKNKPGYVFIENVKNLLSINDGWDFFKVQTELDEIGYDVEWSVLDFAEVVAQHRERVYIIGRLRSRCTRPVFPLVGENGATHKTAITKVIGNTSKTGYKSHDVYDQTGKIATLMARDYKDPKQIAVHQLGNVSDSKSFGGNPHVGRVYGIDGISPTLNTMQGGCREPKVLVKEATKVGYAEAKIGDSINMAQPNSKTRRGRVGKQRANTLLANGANQQATLTKSESIVMPVLTPNRLDKRQNGRRFKTNGEPEFAITTQDRHGIYDGLRIRKLTPRECWRLQGFPDWAFDRAVKAGLSNSQLYKQAGNSVTVPVIKAIAEKLIIDD